MPVETDRERFTVWSERPVWLTPSVVVLVVANLFPLYGVLFQGWQVFPIVLLYWLENVVVGVFFILRIVAASPGEDASPTALEQQMGRAAKLFLVPFFAVHYGIFTLVHGVFVLVLFGRETGQMVPSVSLVFSAITRYSLVLALVALTASHAFSFVVNYLGKGEYRGADLGTLARAPYSRVVVLHLAILGGGFLVMWLQSPVAGLVLLLALKTGLDVAAHLREHRKAAAPTTFNANGQLRSGGRR